MCVCIVAEWMLAKGKVTGGGESASDRQCACGGESNMFKMLQKYLTSSFTSEP